jgi:HSP20 family protein
MDVERRLAEIDAYRRQMDSLFDALDWGFDEASGLLGDHGLRYLGWGTWPDALVFDHGAELVVSADVPGLTAEDIDLQVTQAGLTISGERQIVRPDGYTVHRAERGSFRFSRSINLPVTVDPDQVSAEVRHGVLTVKLPKSPESQPHRITIRS